MNSLWFALAIAASVVLAKRAFPQDSGPLQFEHGRVGDAPAGWMVPTPGWKAEIAEDEAVSGARAVRLFVPEQSTARFGNVMRSVPAREIAGKHVTLTAKMLVVGSGRGQMWLRVDRRDGSMGAFDNMDDRPIACDERGGKTEWQDATIEADIEPDAELLNYGFISVAGKATVFIRDVKFAVSTSTTPVQEPSPARALSPRALENLTAASKLLAYVRFFHPSDAAVAMSSWDRFAVELIDRAEPATDATDLARRLSEAFAPIAPTIDVWAGAPDHGPAQRAVPSDATHFARWRHLGAGNISSSLRGNIYASEVESLTLESADATDDSRAVAKSIGAGVSCRIPIAVPADAAGTLPHAKTAEDGAKSAGALRLTALNRSTRLADVALAWGIFQHFYPYFDVVITNWDAALPVALAKAATDADEVQFLYTLRELVANLHDGHGGVYNMTLGAPSVLPLAIEWAGKDLVVVGTGDGVRDIAVGDAIVSIDGRPIEECYAAVVKQISCATDGWGRTQSQRALVVNLPTKDPAHLVVRKPDGTESSVELARAKTSASNTSTSKRPANGAELAPGLVYFDLNGAETDALDKVMPKLAEARAIVFDMRGYPGEAAMELMKHLIDEPATSARWCVPVITRPDHENVEWLESGRWRLAPKEPRLNATIAFLTDGRAISYAESIMGIVENYKMGEIVGSTTAGTNGNVNPFTLPGGYSVSWTGMKVLKHDGSQHHGVGIAPTLRVVPTAKGISEGRDEVLERAIGMLKSELALGMPAPK
jgi:C-terminal processing protease CtpA/Prc